jgi:hypothetical protein
LKAERDKANTAVAAAPMPARPVTPTPAPMSGYDKVRAQLKALEKSGVKVGREEWEGTHGAIPGGDPNDKKQFSPYDEKPWGSIGKNYYGPKYDPMGKPKEGTGQQASLHRREPGSLLRAADQRQAAASAKHEITGSASLHVKLAAGLAPASALKTKGSLFKETRLDRAPLPLASTTG